MEAAEAAFPDLVGLRAVEVVAGMVLLLRRVLGQVPAIDSHHLRVSKAYLSYTDLAVAPAYWGRRTYAPEGEEMKCTARKPGPSPTP